MSVESLLDARPNLIYAKGAARADALMIWQGDEPKLIKFKDLEQSLSIEIETGLPNLTQTSTQSNLYSLATGGKVITLADGISSAPATDKRPDIFAEKWIDFAYNTGAGNRMDAGVFYGQVTKTAGDAYSVAVTASFRHNGGTGVGHAFQARAQANHANAKVFAGWFYADINNCADGIGAEININNKRATDIGWLQSGFGVGGTIGLIVTSADSGTTNNQWGIYLASQTQSGKWYTGYLSASNAIVPEASGNGEAFRIHGGTTAELAYKAIRLPLGNFTSGIETYGATFARGVMEMSYNHRIAWGGNSTTGGSDSITVSGIRQFEMSGNLRIGSAGDRTINVARRSSFGNGRALTIQAGGVFPTGEDQAGGDLNLYSGISSGVGGSTINAYYYPANSGAAAGDDVTAALGWTISNTGRFRLGGGGNSSSPAYSFNGDPDTGMYLSAANEIAFATGAVQCLSMNANLVYFRKGVQWARKAISAANSPYTLLPDDYYLAVDTSAGAVAINIFAATAAGREVIVKDVSGNASTGNITINPAGSDTIDKAVGFVLNSNYASVRIVADGVSNWEKFSYA